MNRPQTPSDKVELGYRKRLIENYKNVPSALEDLKPEKLPIELAFEYYDIEYWKFGEYLKSLNKAFIDASEEDLDDYLTEIRFCEEFETLLKQAVKEVFYVLFQNRHLLMIFNLMLANVLEMQIDLQPPKGKEILFARPGILKRTGIPSWVKRAVYFRDRGRCVLCDKDLSGMLNLNNKENYDHIVPLSQHGLNDVSNIQLLCKECNQNYKKARDAVTSTRYQSWYPYD